MKVKVYDRKGKANKKKVQLPDEIFDVEPNDHLIYLEVKRYMAQRHSGKHSTKNRSEVRGSGAKIHPQKGTGQARAGDIKNPIFKGGGVTFGPSPRDHSIKVNKKERIHAKKSAFTYKAQDDAVVVVKDFTLQQPKTQKYQEVLDKLEVADKKTLLVMSEYDENLALSARNIPNTKVTTVEGLNIFDIMKAEKIMIFKKAIDQLSEQFDAAGQKTKQKKKTKKKKKKGSSKSKKKKGEKKQKKKGKKKSKSSKSKKKSSKKKKKSKKSKKKKSSKKSKKKSKKKTSSKKGNKQSKKNN